METLQQQEDFTITVKDVRNVLRALTGKQQELIVQALQNKNFQNLHKRITHLPAELLEHQRAPEMNGNRKNSTIC